MIVHFKIWFNVIDEFDLTNLYLSEVLAHYVSGLQTRMPIPFYHIFVYRLCFLLYNYIFKL